MVSAFLWPWALPLLLAGPLLVLHYRRAGRRPAERALLHPEAALAARAAAAGPGWPRHLPAALYLGALLLALLALARPTLPLRAAHPGSGIVLALDISRSMSRGDVTPSRFEAARAAIRDFVTTLPAGTPIALVTFAGYATVPVPLTDDHRRLLDTVELLTMGRGTAIGDALLTSVAALPALGERSSGSEERSGAVILLSDGSNRDGVHPLATLPTIREQRVIVHTIGVGSRDAGAGSGFGSHFRFDETTLRTIADETGGRYVFVDSASELRTVYRDLRRSLVWQVRRDEASALAALAAALVLALALAAGQLRRGVL